MQSTMAGRTSITPQTDQRTRRYRDAERELWQHYGLEPREQFVAIEAPPVRVRLNEIGSGDPVLFIHGMLGTGPYWGPLVNELSGFRCLMMDRPGYGLSAPLDWSRHDMGSAVADVIKGVLDELNIERAHLVGSSIGGVLALHFARRYPSRARSIAMLGGGPLVSEFPIPGVFRLMGSRLGWIIERAAGRPKVMRQIIESSGHAEALADGRIPDLFVKWRTTLQRDTPSMRHERAGLRAIIGRDGWTPQIALTDSDLSAIEHPVLLLQGTNDPTAPEELWRRVMGQLPRGEMKQVDNVGHEPWLDDPRVVASELTRFLRSSR